ncbi:MAG: ATP-dependent DNA helicase RecG [Alphaproteobacteria bacterium]|nr:ATP-dependent DNA helicase RecG [Alphaproteobacteria bacterium]
MNPLFPLFQSITELKGVGDQRRRQLQKLCGSRIIDLLFHLPCGQICRTQEPYITTKVKVLQHIKPFSKKQPYRILTETDDGEIIELVFFNYKTPYFVQQLPEGQERIISGVVENFHTQKQMRHPDYILPVSQADKINAYESVYPLTNGLSNKTLNSVMHEALDYVPPLPEWIPAEIIKQYHWPSFAKALRQIHNPSPDTNKEREARERLAFDELLANQLALAIAKKSRTSELGVAMPTSVKLRQLLLKSLPFELTQAQQAAIKEIDADMATPAKMARLIQGDVGCGKTIVALFAALNALENGYQVCFMAPTDLLSRQHMQTLTQFCETLGEQPYLLTGREKGKARQQILEALQSGQAHIIIGTHALFQDDVRFKKLGLVVIDEQHRFGVDQRIALMQKAPLADMLIMSATPIPRTLALTNYGDIDITRIEQKPTNRQPIQTSAISTRNLDALIERLKTAVVQGRQAYWICPMIEETEKTDLANVKERFAYLKAAFGNRVGLLHGKMKAEEKDAAMQDFISHKTSILVSTTVIEVGVDVPNATIMVIEQAERFGLSQLHQLRGRIGRGAEASQCVLLYGAALSEIARKRLDILRATNDGFAIAEADLQLRGAGEILGTRQSGWQTFRLVDLVKHAPLLPLAHATAKQLLKDENVLKSGQELKLLLYLFRQEQAIQTLQVG